jgi:class 3 adenylate cyclase/membrane protein YdbS with pleckstrin-like domain
MKKDKATVIKTLVLSDLVDSTRITKTLGDEKAAEIFDLHNRAVRNLIIQLDGKEISHTDGFLVFFERPINAVHYALRLHDELEKLSRGFNITLSVRVGIHFGEVVSIADDVSSVQFDYSGLAISTVARMLSICQGGQTLLTKTAFELARRAAVGVKEITEGVQWVAHGHYIFKGIEEPVEIFEVGLIHKVPLKPPVDSEKAHRAKAPGGEITSGKTARTEIISLISGGQPLVSSPETLSIPDSIIPKEIVTLHHTGRVEIGAPTPSIEKLFWKGRQSFWHYLPGLIWRALWFFIWMNVAAKTESLIMKIQFKFIPQGDIQNFLNTVRSYASYASLVIYFFAFLALWGTIKRILKYFNTCFDITTQRIKIRLGMLSRKINQIELSRLKDVEISQSLWGKIFNYAHIRLVSSDKLISDITLIAMPDGENKAEEIRKLSQKAKSESGIVTIKE